MQLSIDIETYSDVNLLECGAYAYSASPEFQVLLFAYAFDDAPVQIVDLAVGEKLPTAVLSALTDNTIIKTAYNANFERTCLNVYLGQKLDAAQWQCTAALGAELGLPQSLGALAKALHMDEQKETKGKGLINYFCKPCKPTIANGERLRNLPQHDNAKWALFKAYCIQEVVVERAVRKKLSVFPMNDSEQLLYVYDQRINDRGVSCDLEFIDNVLAFNDINRQNLLKRAARLTGIQNPNSVAQVKAWVEDRTGNPINGLAKEDVKAIIANTDNKRVAEMLKIRQGLGKSSIAKYKAMKMSAVNVDNENRIRGTLQFYGANRTGRWAGRITQVHNLPQNHLKDLALAREVVQNGDFELFEMLYPDVSQVLSELIRTALIPKKGCRFIVSDFSAIEARVISYLAKEQWRMDVFATHGKIYEASASQMFGVPLAAVTKGSELRKKGKVSELALGYGGGVGALTAMGALKMGLQEDELKPLVNAWRNTNPAIVNLWRDTERAALNAIQDKPSKTPQGIIFAKHRGVLFASLPSGRNLAYVQPQIGTNVFGNHCMTYMHYSGKMWRRVDTFGGKLVENIVQAFARDCLAVSIKRLEDRGFNINFHVHDEVVIEVPVGESSVDEVTNIMGKSISWAKGLILKAEGYECDFYQKD